VANNSPSPPNPLLVIVTGLAGAGGSTALHALADAGMYCIDNLPMEVVGQTIDLLTSGRIVAEHGMALCMDVRDQNFARQFPELKRRLATKVRLEVLFLTADANVIATRYSATRRKHPLRMDNGSLTEAIDSDRKLLGPVEEAADVVLDTSKLSPHQLAKMVETRLAGYLPARVLNVTITSFGFKFGQAQPVDMLFDVRFLDNPYFVPHLRGKSGLDSEVRDFVFSHETARTMLTKVEDMARFLLPLYFEEGKRYLHIGIGCTGGRHRSVCLAAEIGKRLTDSPVANTVVSVVHRDIEQ